MEAPLLCIALIVGVLGNSIPKVENHDPTLPKWKQLALRIIQRQEPDNEDWAKDDKATVVSVSSEDLGTRGKFTIEIHTKLANDHDDVCMVTFYQLPENSEPLKPYAACFCPMWLDDTKKRKSKGTS